MVEAPMVPSSRGPRRRRIPLSLYPLRQRQWGERAFDQNALYSQPILVSLVLVMLASTTVTTAEAGAIGSGRNVPWWYPSRMWGVDHDGGSSWSSYYPTDGSGFWRKKRRNRNGNGGLGNSWAQHDPLRRRQQEIAALAREFVSDCVSEGLGEEEERTQSELQCTMHEAGNATLRRLRENVDRCASPNYVLTEIFPSQLVYTEVDPAVEAAREAEEAKRRKAARREAERVGGPGAKAVEEEDEEGGGSDDRSQPTPSKEEDSFLGIFLFLKGDFFSIELENALTAVAPAYPGAWIVKANAKSFLSFCVQYQLYTFPQLLLFKNGRLVSNFRGRRSTPELAAWLSLQTGQLPRARPRRALPSPTLPNPLSIPGADEPLTWAALLFAVIKIFGAFTWLVKRRGGGVAGDVEAEGEHGGVFGWAKRVGRWFMSFAARRRRKRGEGRRRGMVDVGVEVDLE